MDYLAPKVILSSSTFLPHPKKSKHPNEKFLGTYLNKETAYNFEDEFP